ncbi:MAG: 16S rRNA (guanine(966)-N(2))-methyltransferase RsmD [Alphaproteobacteria bacterium]|nr:16S rRNA (guanine(966)-N(2))-methyltransferase RsmD [Alphaproteobacteria bacterium]
MRIVGGKHRSRKLETPKGDQIRPTSDKVRQAIFNMLTSRGVLQDVVVIDAFCGTGALGLEALSQGARFCIFIDKSAGSLALCQRNIEALGETGSTLTLKADATKLGVRLEYMEPATLIFLDPPYKKDLIPKAVEKLKAGDWYLPEARFILEMDKREELSIAGFEVESEKIYGDTKVIFGRLKT